MAKVSKRSPPKDRTGQKFRCYRVVRTVPGIRGCRYHILRCTKCGAETHSKWFEPNKRFCPLPCDCGSLLCSKLKVGDIRNNKKILKIKPIHPRGFREYEILAQCLNCGAKLTISGISALNPDHNKPQMWCKHCIGESLRISYVGREVGTWKVIDEEKESMTCQCVECGHQIVLLRKHIPTLKGRKCRECLEERKKVDRDKIIYILFDEGYSYKAIGEYFGLHISSVKDVVLKVGPRYEPPLE